ncbi:MAG: ATPase [Lachnospiraceae bacterium]|nr:ATPase [Lachnospiraceae bacterium]
MLSHYKKIESQILNLQKQINTLPSGNLSCAGNGTHYKWYQCDNRTNTYIPKKNKELAEQLALKKYLSLLLEDLLHEQRAIQFYLSHYPNTKKANLLLNNPEYKALLAPYFTPLSQELSEWMNSPYERNPKHPELLLHKSSSGNLVRSKSEAVIDMLLHLNKIPFRYECALQLGDVTLFPDFTVRHPRTGATYYWEHFGLMDTPAYSKNVCNKLQLYTSHGIIPSIQLITTYETKDTPLSADTVEKIIAHYFG